MLSSIENSYMTMAFSLTQSLGAEHIATMPANEIDIFSITKGNIKPKQCYNLQTEISVTYFLVSK